MIVSQAAKIRIDYHRAHSKENTIRAYKFTITKFNQNFENLNLDELSTDDILNFMAKFTEGENPRQSGFVFPPDRIFHFLCEIISIAISKIHVIPRYCANYSDRKQLFIGMLLKKKPSTKSFQDQQFSQPANAGTDGKGCDESR